MTSEAGKKAAHTPGPWWIAGKATVRHGQPRDWQAGWIADVHWKNRAANAALIAAAPELLGALREAESFIMGAVPYYAQDRIEAVNAVLPRIRAAIDLASASPDLERALAQKSEAR